MAKLFVNQTITVDALAANIWRVITDPEYTAYWAREFTVGSPFRIESDWKLGDSVLWKDEHNTIIVEGSVTAVEAPHLLRFTVFAAGIPRPQATSEDGITWELTEENGRTTVHVQQGDFSAIKGGEKNYKQTRAIWGRVLPIVKELAEQL